MQCFCEAGFFGPVMTRPSGMQVRNCNRASELTLDAAAIDFDTFGEEYLRSLDSTSGSFSAYMNPGNDTFEFAMKANTTSWVALGLRSVACAPSLRCARLSACLGGCSAYVCTHSEEPILRTCCESASLADLSWR